MTATLQSLSIRDFAIIDALSIDFDAGFTVLSGETGAGKSILFSALGLLLGDRAESQAVRPGAERAEVGGRFDLAAAPELKAWLEEQDLADPDEPDSLLLRRQISAAGQSRAYINGTPAPLKQLRTLGEQLVDIHGQHAHQLLLRAGEQRALLDAYAGHGERLQALADCHREFNLAQARLEELRGRGGDSAQRAELLRYQLEELEALGPSASEFDELEREFRVLGAVDALLRHAGSAHQLLYAGEASLYDQIQEAMSALDEAVSIDERFAEARQLCEQAQISLKEAGQATESAAAGIEPDPERLQAVSQRLDAYQSLARKHRVDVHRLPAHWEALAGELKDLEGTETELAELSQRLDALREQYAVLSAELSRSREDAARRLAAAVTETVRPLGLPHAECRIRVQHNPEAAPAAHGQDQVELQLSTNPGQPPAPLAKVASGGELARASLAIQVVCRDRAPVPVLLFDEVDVGISGAVAEVVGRRLQELGRRYQVFCVTHQPQVAALATTHFAVSKEAIDGQTYARIATLDDSGRIEELSRMLGGVKITDKTRATAREMLDLGPVPA